MRVRYRSSFGLKYLEIVRGDGEGLAEGGTLPVARPSEQTEFDDIANTFDTPTRENSRHVLEGFGTAFAGPRRLAEPGDRVAQPAVREPAAGRQGAARGADHQPAALLPRARRRRPDRGAGRRGQRPALHATPRSPSPPISSDEEALRDTISEGPPTLEEGIESLPVQEPFLRDFAEFSRLLRPGVRDLRISLPALNGAVAAGAKVLPRTRAAQPDLEDASASSRSSWTSPHTKVDACAGSRTSSTRPTAPPG